MSAFSSVQAAINFVVDQAKTVRNLVGNPAGLQTAAKDNIVNAVNEVNTKTQGVATTANLATLQTSLTTSIAATQQELDDFQTAVGDPSYDFLAATQARWTAQ
jgi:translation elongation factor EF-Ts